VGHQIRANPAQLRAVADAVAPAAAEYRKLYSKLYSDIDRLKAGWQGADQQAYVQQIEGFKEDFEAMAVLMEMYSDFLREAAKTYQQAQDQSASRAAGTYAGF
jgi:WXG100 family type VII secretion target